MNRICWKVTSRSCLPKATLVIRKETVCVKEGKKLFGDDGIHSLIDKCTECNSTIVKWVRFVSFMRYGKCGQAPRKKDSKSKGKLK